jgi:hypothetical protein
MRPLTQSVMSRRMSIKGKFILGCIFFGGMGIVSLFIALDIFFTGTGPQGQKLILNESNNNAVSLTYCFIFKKKPLLFNSMISWIFSVWPDCFSCLNEYDSEIFDNFSHFISGSFEQKNDSIFYL